MTNPLRDHHQLIFAALENFNAEYFNTHHILFGGGTRIALELNEFRESIDIDFICPNRDAFRAVRSETSKMSLGKLVKQDFNYPREIRADRDAVRCFIEISNIAIKLEFISFVGYNLQADPDHPFIVPALSKASCFQTKLLANTDRYADYPYKDIFDILAMFSEWGNIPDTVWDEVDAHYGKKPVFQNLQKACAQITLNLSKYLNIAIKELKIEPRFAEKLLVETNQKLITHLNEIEPILFNNTALNISKKL